MWFGNHLPPHPRLTVLHDGRPAGSTRSICRRFRHDLSPGQHRQRPVGRAEPVLVLGGQRARGHAADRSGGSPGREAVHLRILGERLRPQVGAAGHRRARALAALRVQQDEDGRRAGRPELRRRDGDDHHPAGHRLRLLAPHAPGRRRQHADDAGADEGCGHGARRRSDPAEHPHRRSRRLVSVCARAPAGRESTTPASRT